MSLSASTCHKARVLKILVVSAAMGIQTLRRRVHLFAADTVLLLSVALLACTVETKLSCMFDASFVQHMLWASRTRGNANDEFSSLVTGC